jgi:prophage antirepressor-like protein
MTNLTQFAFQDNQVRVLFLDEQPWFVATDVAKILDYTDPSMMIKHVDDEDKQVINPQKIDPVEMRETFNSNTFKVSIINESGIYAVIFGSTKPEAKIFKKWVTSEVLPQLRKTGSYQVKPKSEIELLIESAQHLLKLQQEQEQIKLEQQLQSQKMAEIETLTHQHDSEIDRIFNPNGHYFTIMGYYIRHKLGAIALVQAAKIGKKVTAFCRSKNILVTPVYDPRFGWVNSYPEDAIALFVNNPSNSKESDNLQIDLTPSIVDVNI